MNNKKPVQERENQYSGLPNNGNYPASGMKDSGRFKWVDRVPLQATRLPATRVKQEIP